MLWNRFLRRLATRYVGDAVVEQRQAGGLLDLRSGAALLRDRETPAKRKLLALGIGIGLTAILAACEAPLELIVGVLLPGAGLLSGLLVDGAEVILCPILFAALVMPYLAPQPVPVAMRADRGSRRLNRH